LSQEHYSGSKFGIKLIANLYKVFGHYGIAWLVALVAFFYAIMSRSKIEELTSYYKAIGLKPNFLTYIKHIYAFSWTIFDRFTATSNIEEFKVDRENVIALEPLKKEGGIVLFSHFGNWSQAYKTFSTFEGTINIVLADAMLNELQELEGKFSNTSSQVNIIDMTNEMQGVIDIANALMKNEVVVMMSDRGNSTQSSIELDFLGKKACFNRGPFEVARMRKKPMMGLSIVRIADNHIKAIYSDTLFIDTTLEKKEMIPDIAQRYVEYLTQVLHKHPLQWYNFFDFFKKKC